MVNNAIYSTPRNSKGVKGRTGSSSWRLSKRKRTGTTASTARNALRLAVKTRKLLDPEFKYWDLHQATVNVQSSPAITLLTGIAQGDDMFQRNGRSLRKSSSYLQALCHQTSGSGTDYAMIRIMIVEDKASNGVVPTGADLYSNVGTTFTCFLNPDNMGERFKVVMSEVIMVGANSVESAWVKQYRKLDTRTTFTGTTGGQTSCATGHLYLVVWGTWNSGVPTIAWSHRTQYVDN